MTGFYPVSMDATWQFNEGDSLRVWVHNPDPSTGYAFPAWDLYSRLQIRYEGPLN